jgi:hypothetical protein
MAAGLYNPTNPAAVGVEWFTTSEASFPLGPTTSVIALRQVATATESVDVVKVYLDNTTAAGTGKWLCEMMFGGVAGAAPTTPELYGFTNGGGSMFLPAYATESGYSGKISSDLVAVPSNGAGAIIIEPHTDVLATAISGSGGGPPWAPVLDTMFSPGALESIVFAFSNSEYRCRSNATGVTRKLSRRRIVSVQIVGVAYSFIASLRPYLMIGSTAYNAPTWSSDGAPAEFQATWYLNPSTGLPWTTADIENFGSSAASWGFKAVNAGGGGGANAALSATALVVNFVDENRMGLGTNVAPTLSAWNSFDLATPTYYNMLTFEEASFETSGGGSDLGGWVMASGGATIASSNAQAFSGSRSLAITNTSGLPTITGTRRSDADQRDYIPITAGRTYYLSAQVRAATTSRNINLEITYYDEDGNVLGSDNDTVADSNSAWTLLALDPSVAPAGACWATLQVNIGSAVNTEVHYVDAVMLLANVSDATFRNGGVARATVPKVSGTDVVYSFRHVAGGSATGPSVHLLDSGSPVPMPSANAITAYFPTLGSDAGNLSSMGDATTYMFGLQVVTSAPANSVDAVAYAKVTSKPVYTGSVQSQLLTIPAIANYGFVKVLISHAGVTTTAPLLVKIKRASDNVQVGPTITIDATSLTPPRANAQIVPLPMDSLVTLTAAQYYLEFSSVAATHDDGWLVYALDTVGGNDAITMGGTTDVLQTNLVSKNDLDVIAFLATVPNAPQGFTVETVC